MQELLTRVRTWEFWRNQAVYLCLFSVVGHWFEIPYCAFMEFCFDIVDDDTIVFDDPFYPFPVYGFGAVVCSLLMVPLRDWLCTRFKTKRGAFRVFYLLGVLLAMVMELTQGFLQNQPNAFGEYPLWDNSNLPFNILGQAWLMNDIMISFVISLYVWVLYPHLESAIAKLPPRTANIGAAMVVIAFLILCTVKFAPEAGLL